VNGRTFPKVLPRQNICSGISGWQGVKMESSARTFLPRQNFSSDSRTSTVCLRDENCIKIIRLLALGGVAMKSSIGLFYENLQKP
jgi:hypothetical protein